MNPIPPMKTQNPAHNSNQENTDRIDPTSSKTTSVYQTQRIQGPPTRIALASDLWSPDYSFPALIYSNENERPQQGACLSPSWKNFDQFLRLLHKEKVLWVVDISPKTQLPTAPSSYPLYPENTQKTHYGDIAITRAVIQSELQENSPLKEESHEGEESLTTSTYALSNNDNSQDVWMKRMTCTNPEGRGSLIHLLRIIVKLVRNLQERRRPILFCFPSRDQMSAVLPIAFSIAMEINKGTIQQQNLDQSINQLIEKLRQKRSDFPYPNPEQRRLLIKFGEIWPIQDPSSIFKVGQDWQEQIKKNEFNELTLTTYVQDPQSNFRKIPVPFQEIIQECGIALATNRLGKPQDNLRALEEQPTINKRKMPLDEDEEKSPDPANMSCIEQEIQAIGNAWEKLNEQTNGLRIEFLPCDQTAFRYIDVHCHKETAVALPQKMGSRTHLHANRIMAPLSEIIITQAPIKGFQEEFWLTVHSLADENALNCRIFDLTTDRDFIGPYSPSPNQPIEYETLTLEMQERGNLRHFPGVPFEVYSLQQQSGIRKMVQRIHYGNWTDRQKCSLDDLAKLVVAMKEGNPARVIVHCKAGQGRSGTLVAAYLLKLKHEQSQLKKETLGKAIVEVVLQVRQSRGVRAVSEDQFDLLFSYAKSLIG